MAMALSSKQKQYLFFFILFVIILFGLWRTIGSNWFKQKAKRQIPQAIMHNVTVIQMDAQGNPSSQLISPQLINYQENNITYSKTPKVTLYDAPSAPWHLTAKYGKAFKGINEIYVWDHVIMHRPAGKNNPPAHLFTDNFTFFPKTKHGFTHAPVKLTQPGMVLTAIGATADLKQKKITLLSHTKGIYTNTKAKQTSRTQDGTTRSK